MNRASGAAAAFATSIDGLHFQNISADDMVAIARRVWAGFPGMKEGQQHSSRFHQRPKASDHRFYQSFFHVICNIPAQDEIELRIGINQVVCQEPLFIRN